ncbi:MAG: hypothetical protein AMXMBFR47_21000 [Planctomycetota bacterium]
MRNDTIDSRPARFCVETFSNGLFVQVARLADERVAFVQGEDAVRLVDELDRATDIVTGDDILSNYFD